MAGVPIQFRKRRERAISSYTWNELQGGTGIQVFYGIASEDSGGIDYHLTTTKTLISSSVSTARTQPGQTTLDFDLGQFNLPQFVRGTAYFHGTITVTSADTGRLLVQLKKWNGSSATNITAEITGQTVGAGNTEIVYLELPVTTETHFKKGDILRLTVKIELDATTPPYTITFYHDPADTTPPGGLTAVMQVQVPFKLDL